jgi:DNA-binding NtrC family response regulator
MRTEANPTVRPDDARRVLVIEAQPDLRELLCGLLMMLDYDPDAACDGQEALELLEDDGPYQLVISRLAMRGLDGWDVVADVRRQAPTTPMIVVTDAAVLADYHRASQEGVLLVQKPFRIEAFRASVHHALGVRP